MALIPRDVVDAVRERTDIVAVVGRHVRLEKKGTSWVGLCPFHKEKPLPLPQGEDALLQRHPRQAALLLLRLSGGRGRHPLPHGGGEAQLR